MTCDEGELETVATQTKVEVVVVLCSAGCEKMWANLRLNAETGIKTHRVHKWEFESEISSSKSRDLPFHFHSILIIYVPTTPSFENFVNLLLTWTVCESHNSFLLDWYIYNLTHISWIHVTQALHHILGMSQVPMGCLHGQWCQADIADTVCYWSRCSVPEDKEYTYNIQLSLNIYIAIEMLFTM